MYWNAEAYFKASQEHLNEAWSFFYSDTGNHNLYAHYWAGIAIECMLRAYQLQDSKEWEGRHDLLQLFQSGFEKKVSKRSAVKTSTLLTEVARRWNSNHRYATPEMLVASLHSKRVDVQLKGDPLRNNARRMLGCAQHIVTLGAERWRK